jgi:predicted O-methyltransferase YrrM
MDKLQVLINERPMFHKGETEISRPFTSAESLLSDKEIQKIADTKLTCYGIGKEVLEFIGKYVKPYSKTLETGAGCSTLVFAYCGAQHTAVTPSQTEIELIKKYAAEQEIDMSKVNFVPHSSDYFLPRNEEKDYDLILLDGKHAFPWPIVDWFYTADKLRQGGLMLIDDAHMKSVSILVDFMKADSGWEMVQDFGSKTIVFKKLRVLAHDVAWHMQAYTVVNTSPLKKISNKLKQMVNGGN